MQFLCFKIDDNRYAISSEYVDTTLTGAEIFQFPGMPPHLVGCLKHNNSLKQVIDLKKLFHASTDVSRAPYKIVLIKYRTSFGILVDEIFESIDLFIDPGVSKESFSNISNKKYIENLGEADGRLIPIVSMDFLLSCLG